ncbi:MULTISPECIES: helix-turn-helix domain-containing protein [unclassified Streptomyces]|uniref:winged helix-turn-helix transcriptional regulator n=1 Tax=unclassified Streptomyces TaxID=2593676 RepID=UPI000F5B90F8|nr:MULTISPECIES: helix-turn-helix domain-containing protein [unclassified Streptomyces]WSG48743.1 helix-turn-helix transcriptional regulator [Streptomyces sp. NBC_01732]WSW99394.1 helix-turn-helix transcriptional regulator [Streptomyces sp. NBC_00987]MCX4399155.1 helix-turn-helix transcriptional regulator [Streptomyces sp. NBC_01767]MCX5098435.1 helix-turn-helix transcriptional regulator [Streptomyces sp. NBC_00439]MCX5157858.1 helix-turn-helix transcriptional regulator [Streptomyces sp. NBC_0
METEQIGRASEDANVMRADSLAREIFSGVANKWALLIINVLGTRTLRFTELRTEVEGISHKMLTQTLRGLERDGVVHRTVYATVPPRVEYRLTEAGEALRETVNGMCAWTRRYLDEIEAARRRFAGQDPGATQG